MLKGELIEWRVAMKILLGKTKTKSASILFAFKDRLQDDVQNGIHINEQMGGKAEITWHYGRNGETNLLVVGLGEVVKLDVETIRIAAGNAGRAVEKEKGIITLDVSFDAFPLDGPVNKTDAVTAWVEGWLLGTYVFDKYKSNKQPQSLQEMYINSLSAEGIEAAIRLGEIRAEGTIIARDLANEPPNILRPDKLAERAEALFFGDAVQVKVYRGEELIAKQMNGIIAVGKGSEYPPALIELSYCSDPSKPLTALIGKGITFDTGGISLKSGRDLSNMRIDMGGAAAVLGALHIMVKTKQPVNVVILVAAAENMPDSRSMLPGEVIRYANGISVQVKNTDAEGRLVLADALIHAANLGAARIVDIATLTGACAAALGDRIAGILGHAPMLETLQRAGSRSGEKVWPLPLEDEYEDSLKSHYADLSNISTLTLGGAITAALFLRRFVDPNCEWAHIDMAGPMETDSTKGYNVAGATGYGARLLADFITESLK
jgi:leucyl aminopeptidase